MVYRFGVRASGHWKLAECVLAFVSQVSGDVLMLSFWVQGLGFWV